MAVVCLWDLPKTTVVLSVSGTCQRQLWLLFVSGTCQRQLWCCLSLGPAKDNCGVVSLWDLPKTTVVLSVSGTCQRQLWCCLSLGPAKDNCGVVCLWDQPKTTMAVVCLWDLPKTTVVLSVSGTCQRQLWCRQSLGPAKDNCSVVCLWDQPKTTVVLSGTSQRQLWLLSVARTSYLNVQLRSTVKTRATASLCSQAEQPSLP